MAEKKQITSIDLTKTMRESVVKVTDFPSNANKFWKKFAQVFLQEKFEEAREIAHDFLDKFYDDSACLFKLKNAFELLGERRRY